MLALVLLGAVSAAPLAAAPAQAATPGTTYYVDCSRKTGGDGISAPFRSLKTVNAHAAFQPGDRLLLKRGTTCKGQLHPKGSGTSAAPILLGAYPAKGTRPLIVGGGTGNRTGAVQLVDQQHWTVQDLRITNATKSINPTTYRAGLLLLNRGVGTLSGIVVQRLSISDVRSNPGRSDYRHWGGISVITRASKTVSAFHGVRIRGNSLSKVSRTGISVTNTQWPHSYDEDVRISGNRLSRPRGDGIILEGAQHSRIDHNVVANAAHLGPCPKCGKLRGPTTASAGIWPNKSNFITIDRNEVYGTSREAGDGQGFDVDQFTHRIVLEHNYSHDNQGGGMLFCGSQEVTVRFNVLQNNGRASFTFTCDTPVKKVWIYNNTVFQKKSVAANYVVQTYKGFRAKDVRFLNNIVYSYGVGKYRWPTTPKVASNTLVGVHHATAPKGHGTSYRDPRLKKPGSGRTGFGSTKGYHPTSLTRALRGVGIPASATTDFFGKKVAAAHPVRGAAGTR